jgi:hypothetical protein
MIFCLVYENAQNRLLATIECPATTNNIVQNAVVLVQCLWFIGNEVRFSPKDAQLYEENISGSNHDLDFMGYGVDDFISKEKECFPSSIGLKGHSRWIMQTCIFQMLKLYLN